MVYNKIKYGKKKEDFIMKKNIIKTILVVLLAVLVVASFASTVSAAEVTFSSVNEKTVVSGAKDSSGAASSVQSIIGAILTVVQVVGSGVAVIMLIVLAIKYISAAPSDKAEIKKHAVVYVVGAVVLFAASGIIGIVRNFAGNVQPAS